MVWNEILVENREDKNILFCSKVSGSPFSTCMKKLTRNKARHTFALARAQPKTLSPLLSLPYPLLNCHTCNLLILYLHNPNLNFLFQRLSYKFGVSFPCFWDAFLLYVYMIFKLLCMFTWVFLIFLLMFDVMFCFSDVIT